MFNRDPRTDPEKANESVQDHHTHYAWRTVSTVFVFVFALLVVGAFVGWYFYAPEIEERNAIAVDSEQVVDEPELPQAPGNEYAESTGRSRVYNFFYRMFGGIEDGLEENPHNLQNIEHIDQLNIDVDDHFSGGAEGILAVNQYFYRLEQRAENVDDNYRHSAFDVVGSKVVGIKGDKAGEVHDILIEKETGKALSVIIDEDGQAYERDLALLRFKRVDVQQPDGDIRMTITEDTLEDKSAFNYGKIDAAKFISLRALRNGQIIDVDGNIVGQIDAVIYQNAEAQQVYFELRPAIAAQTSEDIYGLPYNAINVVKSADGYDIKLSKKQTEALATTVFKDIERN